MNAFSCASPTGASLCFYGSPVPPPPASCVACACDAGWRHDRVIYHSGSCTLPDNALLGVLVAYWAGAAAVLVKLARWRANKGNRPVQALAALQVVAWGGHVSATYAQEGTFEWAIVGLAVWFPATHALGYLLWYRFATPIYKMTKRSTERLTKMFVAVTVVCFMYYLGMSAALIGLSAQGNDLWFNWVNSHFLFWMMIIFAMTCMGIVFHIERLRRHCLVSIANSGDGTPGRSRSLESFVKRARTLQTFIAVFFSAIFFSGMVLPITFWSLHSQPFAWVLYSIISLGPLVIGFGVAIFYDTKSNEASSSEQPMSVSVRDSAAPRNDA
jgi:hypothetical protein